MIFSPALLNKIRDGFRAALTVFLVLFACAGAMACSEEGGDVPEFIQELRGQAEQGDAKAQFNLGVMYYNGWGVPQNDAERVKWTRRAAEQGLAEAQYRMAVMYGGGRSGLPKDYVESAKWHHRAAEQGHAAAQFELGMSYEEGRGVPQNKAESEKWLHLAAGQGDFSAQSHLCMNRESDSRRASGDYVFCMNNDVAKEVRDNAETAKWILRAAEYGIADAQYGIAIWYNGGTVIPQDKAAAARWYRRAADQGHDGAQLALALAYGNGEGVPQNYQEAYIWLSIAKANGVDIFEFVWNDAVEKLTKTELSAAQVEATRRHAEIQRKIEN